MNCINHPAVAAITQCADCGKGLCPECVADQKKLLCSICVDKRKTDKLGSSIVYLILYAILFTVGYKYNFMSSKGSPDGQLLSGYVLMAVVSGWQFLNSIIGWKLVQGDLLTWGIYFVLKLLASVVIGFITAPFTILWNIIKFIRNICK